MRIEMHLVKCSEASPEKDGRYHIATLDDMGNVDWLSTVLFTTGGGWNTYYKFDGTVFTDNRIRYDDSTEYPEAYWADSVVLTEDDDE